MTDTESEIEFESADEGEEEKLNIQNNTSDESEKNKKFCVTNKFSEEQQTDENFLNAFDRNISVNEILIKGIQTEETENVKETNIRDNVTNKTHQSLENDMMLDNKLDDEIKEKPKRVKLKLEKKLEKLQKNIQVQENQDQVLEKLANLKVQEDNVGWGWSGWGSSLLSTAASSVSVFTSQVSQGIGTVFETVEATLGAPPPEELAMSIKTDDEDKRNSEENIEQGNSDSTLIEKNKLGLLDGVSSLTKVIETTGTKVIMGGLDTLELIGKKTYDILTENDPGFRKKRSYFSNYTNLSEVLREAKEKEAISQFNTEEKEENPIYYSVLFDNFQGLAHLEALEILSRQSKTKVQEILIMHSGREKPLKEQFDKLQEICENLPPIDDLSDEETDQDFIHFTDDYSRKLDLNITKLQEVHKRIHNWLEKCQKEQDERIIKDPKEIYQEALTSLAELTARSIELFHKSAEVLLTNNSHINSTYSFAEQYTEYAGVLCLEIKFVAAKFCQCLNTAADDSSDPDSITPFITNVYLEASNSATYIQDAFQLIVPVFQVISTNQ